MNAKHTPGPWYFSLSRSSTSFIVRDQDRRMVCDMSWHHSSREHYALRVESEANARLIAAAPELLEAVQELAVGLIYIHGDKANGVLKRAMAAIAKATGSDA